MRELRYRTIADALRQRVAAGELGAGALLPSEAELSATYGASRVTVRNALESLRREGLVDARQGFGWFVAGDPLRQELGRLGTIEAQLEASGVRAERRVLDFRYVRATEEVARLLGAAGEAGEPGDAGAAGDSGAPQDSGDPGAPGSGTGTPRVLRVRRLNLADGQPFARVTVWAPEAVGRQWSRAEVERSTFYELLGDRLGGATQVIGAAAAEPRDAALLGVPAGSPVLRCRRVTFDRRRVPVLVAVHVFPALRTEFVVELSAPGPSMGPSGLRLVE